MDILSHGFTGAILTGALVKNPTRKQVLIGAGLALLPDMDTIAALWGRQYYFEYHRVIFHSIFFAILASLLLAWFFSKKGWFTFVQGTVISFLAILSHLFLDGMTSWGTAIFYPLSNVRYAGNVVFMFDVWYPFWCAVLLYFCIHKKVNRAIYMLAFVLSACYFLMAFTSKVMSKISFEEQVNKNIKGTVSDIFLVAQPWSPWTWAGFAVDESKIYYAVKPHFSNTFESFKSVDRMPESAELRELQNNTEVINFKTFARLPWVELVDDNGIKSYRWIDLSKEVSGIEQSNKNFGVRVDIDSQGRILYKGFTYPSR